MRFCAEAPKRGVNIASTPASLCETQPPDALGHSGRQAVQRVPRMQPSETREGVFLLAIGGCFCCNRLHCGAHFAHQSHLRALRRAVSKFRPL